MPDTFRMIKQMAVLFISVSAFQAAWAQTTKKPKTEPEVLPVLTEEHISIAQRVETGRIACELGQSVNLRAHGQSNGHFLLDHGRQTYVMQPVATTTGAIRLEDAKSGAVWLQLANKSMLMNHKQGKRLADACVTPQQLAVAREMALNPPRGALD